MDYQRIYNAFIADRRARRAKKLGYTERHHILPRSLGGGDEPSNLIRLTARDHYFAHCLLAKIHGGGMWQALYLLSNNLRVMTGRNRYTLSRIFEVTKREMAEMSRALMVGNQRSLGTVHTDEWKEKSRERLLGNKHSLGFKHTKETRIKRSAALTGNQNAAGYRHEEEFIARMSARMAGGDNPSAKTTKTDVLRIHSMKKTGRFSRKDLADIFGLTVTQIGSILSGACWPDVYEEVHGHPPR